MRHESVPHSACNVVCADVLVELLAHWKCDEVGNVFC